MDGIRQVKTEKMPISGDHDRMGGKINTSMLTINVSAGPFNQIIPLTEESIKLGIGFLELLKLQIKPEKKVSEEEKAGEEA